MAAAISTCAAIVNRSGGRLRQGAASRGVRAQRRAVAPRAGLLDTLIKPITRSGEVGGGGLVCNEHCGAAAAAAAARWVMRGLAPPAHSLLQGKPLKEGIANFYDESSQLWESIWVRGEIMQPPAVVRLMLPPALPAPVQCCKCVDSACSCNSQGEHMHHGYYPKGGQPKSNQQAQASAARCRPAWLAGRRAGCPSWRGFGHRSNPGATPAAGTRPAAGTTPATGTTPAARMNPAAAMKLFAAADRHD